jgi:uncharacterized protein YndB with AHSA1/START domain
MMKEDPGAGTATHAGRHPVEPSAARSVRREMEIDAPPAAVWLALTDARELVRWFPLGASVTPGAGGVIQMSWGSDASTQRIEIWEPERHLRTVESATAWSGIINDFVLEGRAGKTVLRVVSSGFSAGDDWDDLLQSFGTGWDFELRGLRHYLERHRGRDRDVACVRVTHHLGYEEAWRRATTAGGLITHTGAEPGPGDVMAVRASGTEVLTGEVILWQSPRQAVARVPSWNDALVRFELYATTATLWMSTYDVPPARVRALEEIWNGRLGSLLLGS